jgi:hypothetical protein
MNKRLLIYYTLICFFIFSFSVNLQAQHKNDFEAGIYNISFGGLVGGIGAIINKKTNEKTGKVFIKGFYQGALGGYLIFESKRLITQLAKTKNYAYAWPSKLVNSVGVSIIENSAANRSIFDQLHLNIGFNRLEFHTKDAFSMRYRIMPFALGNAIFGFAKGKLDLDVSLKLGNLVFSVDKINSHLNSEFFSVEGYTISNSIVYLKNNVLFSKEEILSHEIIHVYQYEVFSGFNLFLNKPLNNWLGNYKWYNTYNKLFYTDFNYLIFQGLYSLNKNADTNFFEKEARYYTELN